MKRRAIKSVDPNRPVDEPVPLPIATKPYRRNPIFEGLCYFCNTPTRGLYCYEHREFEGKP